jgi:hypothetical protein
MKILGPAPAQSNELITQKSLYTAMKIVPEIASALVQLYPQYSMTYLTAGMGNLNGKKAQFTGNKSYRWSVMGMPRRTVRIVSVVAPIPTQIGIQKSQFTVECEGAWVTKNDIIELENKQQFFVLNEPMAVNPSGTRFRFTGRLVTKNEAEFITPTSIINKQAGCLYTAFPERSEKGYSKRVFPEWYQNNHTIGRRGFEMSGDAFTDAVILEHNKKQLWAPKELMQITELFNWEREMNLWFGRSTVDENGICHLQDDKGRDVWIGDGLIEQIHPSFRDTYSTSITLRMWENIMGELALRAKDFRNNVWMVMCGHQAYYESQRILRDFLFDGQQQINFATSSGDKSLKVGQDFGAYHFGGNTIILKQLPFFSDPGRASTIDPVSLRENEASRMIFCNFGSYDGVNNCELMSKGQDGKNRFMLMKYISGMQSPNEISEDQAATSVDGFAVEFLGESSLKVMNPYSCFDLQKVNSQF